MKRYSRVWIAGMFALACGGRADSAGLAREPEELAGTHASAGDPIAFTALDAPGMSSTRATGINDSGQIVVTAYSAGRAHAFVLAAGLSTNIDIPLSATCYPSPCPTFETAANGINAAGDIVGAFGTIRTRFYWGYAHGFLRSNGAVTRVDMPRAFATQALGINGGGQIVGRYLDTPIMVDFDYYIQGKAHGFLRSNGVFTKIEPPGAVASGASGINDAGQIVGWFGDGHSAHGFLFDGNGYTSIDVPGAIRTSALGINAAGQIAGTFTDASSVNRGFLLSSGVFTTIDLPGVSGTNVLGLNDVGQIVGSYAEHGFVASSF
jgi:uncharacterized membrane protein